MTNINFFGEGGSIIHEHFFFFFWNGGENISYSLFYTIQDHLNFWVIKFFLFFLGGGGSEAVILCYRGAYIYASNNICNSFISFFNKLKLLLNRHTDRQTNRHVDILSCLSQLKMHIIGENGEKLLFIHLKTYIYHKNIESETTVYDMIKVIVLLTKYLNRTRVG